jgi:Ger(x)C family germination protein
MTKRWRRRIGLLLIAFVAVLVSGCYDRLDLEEASSPFLVGYDLDANNDMIVYVTNPVFSEHVGKKTHDIRVKADTSREAREKEDIRSAGTFHGRKIQVVVIGKRFMQHPDWFRILDVYFRDSRNSLTPRVVAFNGPLSEIIDLHQKNQPMLPILLRDMIDTKSARSESVDTTLQELHRQVYEKGMTPYISEVDVVNNEVVLQGTTLLDHSGKFATNLNTEESILLRVLQNSVKKTVSLTIPIPGVPKQGPFETDRLSFSTEQVKTEIDTAFDKDRFRFDIRVRMRVALTERLFTYAKGEEERLERLITEQVQQKMDDLVLKLKRNRVDPIGLGLSARAHEYNRYKTVEEQWGETVSESDIRTSVMVELGSTGPVK